MLVALLLMAPAFLQAYGSGKFVVQDDVRQHVAWTQRFENPSFFPNDHIADYFQSAAPVGYSALYRVVAFLGIPPLGFAKFLPFPLSLFIGWLTFRVTLAIVPDSVAAFFSALFLQLNIWLKDDVPSSTPRAFAIPLTLIFLDCLLRKKWRSGAVALVLQALFYPPMVPVSIATWGLSILSLKDLRQRPIRIGLPIRSFVASVCVVGILLGYFAFRMKPYGPLVTRGDAVGMPEFGILGRTSYFTPNPTVFWLWAERSGALPTEWFQFPVAPPQVWLVIAVPLLALIGGTRFLKGEWVTRARPVMMFLGSAVGFFSLAHLLLFRLYLPSRHLQNPVRISIALCAGILAAGVGRGILDALPKPDLKPSLGRLLLGIGVLGVLAYPVAMNAAIAGCFPNTRYVVGGHADLYGFLKTLPMSARLACLDEEGNNFQVFAGRSVMAGRESAIPYHSGYYRVIRERAGRILRIQYGTDLADIQNELRALGATHLVIAKDAYHPSYLALDPWLHQYQPEADRARAVLDSGTVPVMRRLMGKCAIWESGSFWVVDAARVLEIKPSSVDSAGK